MKTIKLGKKPTTKSCPFLCTLSPLFSFIPFLVTFLSIQRPVETANKAPVAKAPAQSCEFGDCGVLGERVNGFRKRLSPGRLGQIQPKSRPSVQGIALPNSMLS